MYACVCSFVECVDVPGRGREEGGRERAPSSGDGAQRRGRTLLSLPLARLYTRYYAFCFECGLALGHKVRRVSVKVRLCLVAGALLLLLIFIFFLPVLFLLFVARTCSCALASPHAGIRLLMPAVCDHVELPWWSHRHHSVCAWKCCAAF